MFLLKRTISPLGRNSLGQTACCSNYSEQDAPQTSLFRNRYIVITSGISKGNVMCSEPRERPFRASSWRELTMLHLGLVSVRRTGRPLVITKMLLGFYATRRSISRTQLHQNRAWQTSWTVTAYRSLYAADWPVTQWQPLPVYVTHLLLTWNEWLPEEWRLLGCYTVWFL
jgi:hypothetical protein